MAIFNSYCMLVYQRVVEQVSITRPVVSVMGIRASHLPKCCPRYSQVFRWFVWWWCMSICTNPQWLWVQRCRRCGGRKNHQWLRVIVYNYTFIIIWHLSLDLQLFMPRDHQGTNLLYFALPRIKQGLVAIVIGFSWALKCIISNRQEVVTLTVTGVQYTHEKYWSNSTCERFWKTILLISFGSFGFVWK